MTSTIKRAAAALAALLLLLAGAFAEPAEIDNATALPDGVYEPDAFAFSGGSGRVTITCPEVRVTDGRAYATIVFSSPNYPYLIAGGEQYTTGHEGDTSFAEIPIALGRDNVIQGLTTAMSSDHLIEYTVRVSIGEQADGAGLPGLVWEGSTPLAYARCFTIDRYAGGYRLLRVEDGDSILVVPEGMDVPEGLPGGVTAVRRPVGNVYLAATSAMSLIDALDAVDAVRMSSLRSSAWTVASAREAMERGDMLFAGKYSEPDYELLVRQDCSLAVESTMIYHAPKVKEMLELLGIPVIVDRSSYEAHPMGRTEWIKFYGALLGREDEADAFFRERARVVDAYRDLEGTGRTVAFFSVSADGRVSVRAPEDYIPKMIAIAGGVYVPADLPGAEGARSTVSVTMEEFYAAAVDADFLIYNAAIDEPLSGLDALIAKSPLFADFEAVRQGNVWSTGKDLYQATAEVSGLIEDLHAVLTGGETEMRFLHKVS